MTGTGSSTPPVPQSPYNEEPHQVPGRIEAEEYDLGGEGKAYHEENVNGNEGGADFRDDQVDIETTGDTTGLYNICYILQDEWLEYTVNVVTSSIYTLELRVASEDESKSLHIEMDGENLTGDIEIPNTGDWQNWTTVSVGINLTEGQHIMRIAFDSDYMNLNFVEFKDQETLVKNRKSIISNSSSKLILAHVAEGFKIKIEGDFNYRLTDLKGAIIEAGKGKNVVIVGVGLTPGVYLISVRNKMNKFIRKVINN